MFTLKEKDYLHNEKRNIRLRITTSFRSFFRKLRRTQAYKKGKADLREFVYLDEISVYSLIASRLGSIAVEFSETETKSLQGEMAGSFEANTGFLKGGINSQLLETRLVGSHVLRRSIVQTHFKELYENEKSSLVMRPISIMESPPIVNDVNELLNISKQIEDKGWIINPTNLTRGRLIEVEVLLEAESIFRIAAIVSIFREIIEENPKLFGLSVDEELLQVKTIERILEKLLVGLVPIRGYAIDYKIIEINGKQWILHNSIINQIKNESLIIKPLYIVGVTEQTLFWKDIRRILFANTRYRVLCRVSNDNIQTSWEPVKLKQILESVSPDISKQIDGLKFGNQNISSTLNNSYNLKQQRINKKSVGNILKKYANLIANHYKYQLSDQELLEIDDIARKYSGSFIMGVEKRREVFNAIADYLLDRMNIEREPLIIAEYRSKAIDDTNLDNYKQSTYPFSEDDILSNPESDECFIDSEFVAIYW